MLEYLRLENVGPAPSMELAPRLNLLTGDNGLGKSFLLDCAWWALTQKSVQRAFSYLQTKKSDLGIARDLDTSDLHVEVIDLLGNRGRGRTRRRIFRRYLLGTAQGSGQRRAAHPRRPQRAGQRQARSLAHRTSPGRQGQWRQARLIPIENKRNFLDVSADIMEHVDPIFSVTRRPRT